MIVLVALPSASRLLRDNCINHGADECIEPPIDKEAVLGLVLDLLNGHVSRGARQVLRYAGLELRIDERELYHGTERIPLRPKIFELLRILIENPERVFTRAELIQKIGKEGARRPHLALISRIGSLRASLDQAGLGDLVRTVGTRGYALARSGARLAQIVLLASMLSMATPVDASVPAAVGQRGSGGA